mgnify:CR=1 FL=1
MTIILFYLFSFFFNNEPSNKIYTLSLLDAFSFKMTVITEKGQMIRIGMQDNRIISRNTQGVRIINLEEGDRVVSATSVEPEEDEGAAGVPEPDPQP